MKIKKMPLSEFEEILKRDWQPVELVGSAIPLWARNIPAVYVCGSGTGAENLPPSSAYSSRLISSGALIGGIDVYRLAPDDPVELNKDWYAVVRCDDDPTMLLVDGPIKDSEHWLNDIPGRVRGLEVLGVPKACFSDGNDSSLGS